MSELDYNINFWGTKSGLDLSMCRRGAWHFQSAWHLYIPRFTASAACIAARHCTDTARWRPHRLWARAQFHRRPWRQTDRAGYPLYRGEGFMSLQRSFLLAGSNSVIANLWRVEERVTRDVTLGFFQLWSKGDLRKSAALRQAQLATIKALEEDSLYVPHPYFWAAPVLTGVPN